jgi:hypothetical protein
MFVYQAAAGNQRIGNLSFFCFYAAVYKIVKSKNKKWKSISER